MYLFEESLIKRFQTNIVINKIVAVLTYNLEDLTNSWELLPLSMNKNSIHIFLVQYIIMIHNNGYLI